jgi:gamma-glutamyltranspeptidase/glutathione hydrolase
MDDDYLKQRMSNFMKSHLIIGYQRRKSNVYESTETTHYSIVDQFGMPFRQQQH